MGNANELSGLEKFVYILLMFQVSGGDPKPFYVFNTLEDAQFYADAIVDRPRRLFWHDMERGVWKAVDRDGNVWCVMETVFDPYHVLRELGDYDDF
jgi:hypothetical protein